MSELGLVEYFFCGGVGGMCTVLVGHPLDTIKVRLQTMPVPTAGMPPLYHGAFDCFKKILKNEGVRGFFKGMGTPLAAVTPIFAISFMSYGLGQMIFKTRGKGMPHHYRQLFLAGAFSGIPTTILMAPGERIKCLLQIQRANTGKAKLYDGPIDCAKKLYKQGGIREIYKGSGATLLRDVPGSGVYFVTYEYVSDLVNEETQSESLFGTVFAGGCAGVFMWIVMMPMDVLKSRVQTAPSGTYPRGVRDVLRKMLRAEGPLALYKGIYPVLIRAFPANAACFVGFELTKDFLDFLGNVLVGLV